MQPFWVKLNQKNNTRQTNMNIRKITLIALAMGLQVSLSAQAPIAQKRNAR